MRRERERELERLLRAAGRLPLGARRVLDVGCGTGEILAGFVAWGARPENLYGVDLLAERVRRARENHPELTFQEANAESLPFGDGYFEVVVLFTVFTSILDSGMARNLSREADRVLGPGGVIAWYDFRLNNPLNRHVRGVSRRKIRRLFPGFALRLKPVTLLPPLARRLGGLTGALYPALSALPFLRSHYLGVLVKP
jgi:ubiquinone/menaquinone biosynthesis C-methylase UbiE